MSKHKQNWVQRKRAGSLPTCYGEECGRCPHPCKWFAEWQEDRLREVNEKELRSIKSRIDAELYGRVN